MHRVLFQTEAVQMRLIMCLKGSLIKMKKSLWMEWRASISWKSRSHQVMWSKNITLWSRCSSTTPFQLQRARLIPISNPSSPGSWLSTKRSCWECSLIYRDTASSKTWKRVSSSSIEATMESLLKWPSGMKRLRSESLKLLDSWISEGSLQLLATIPPSISRVKWVIWIWSKSKKARSQKILIS